jgi:protein-arginine kinase activator protein McsA
MGIAEEFYQKTILVCLDELLRSSQVTVKDTGDASTVHELAFAVLKRCDKCSKYLKEIVHQHFVCQGMYNQCFTSQLQSVISFVDQQRNVQRHSLILVSRNENLIILHSKFLL